MFPFRLFAQILVAGDGYHWSDGHHSSLQAAPPVWSWRKSNIKACLFDKSLQSIGFSQEHVVQLYRINVRIDRSSLKPKRMGMDLMFPSVWKKVQTLPSSCVRTLEKPRPDRTAADLNQRPASKLWSSMTLFILMGIRYIQRLPIKSHYFFKNGTCWIDTYSKSKSGW